MKFEWSKELEINVKEMDHQHETLVSKIKDLVAKLESGDFSLACFDDLAGYVVKHFQEEEAYMEKVGFPGLKGHQLIHKKLLEDVGGFRTQIEAKTVDVLKLKTFLSIWLTSHIKGIDKQYANHANGVKQSA